MGRIVSSFFISLDGVVERPDQWHFPYFDDAMGAVVSAGMERTGAFLLGRKLYDEWSAYWPSAAPDDDFGSFITAIPKYVLSTTLTEATWAGTTLITEDAEARVRAVKESTDGDVALSGCATTVRWLLGHDLLDELSLLVHPIAVGSGQRLFEGTPQHPLRLIESTTLSSGVLHLRYAPEPVRSSPAAAG